MSGKVNRIIATHEDREQNFARVIRYGGQTAARMHAFRTGANLGHCGVCGLPFSAHTRKDPENENANGNDESGGPSVDETP